MLLAGSLPAAAAATTAAATTTAATEASAYLSKWCCAFCLCLLRIHLRSTTTEETVPLLQHRAAHTPQQLRRHVNPPQTPQEALALNPTPHVYRTKKTPQRDPPCKPNNNVNPFNNSLNNTDIEGAPYGGPPRGPPHAGSICSGPLVGALDRGPLMGALTALSGWPRMRTFIGGPRWVALY